MKEYLIKLLKKRKLIFITLVSVVGCSNYVVRKPYASLFSITRNLSISEETLPKIPHILLFTFDENILEKKEPSLFYENIQNTISSYTEAWNETDVRVEFLDDKRCHELLETVYPALVPHFLDEPVGVFRGDVCRIVGLYFYGGYYFDVDLGVIKPAIFESTTTFATVDSNDEFFQAFIASSPKNPILLYALKYMHQVYLKGRERAVNIGPVTLKNAFRDVPVADKGENVFLHELLLRDDMKSYPMIPRPSGYGCCCNFVVHDHKTKTVYFWSRIVGHSFRCSKEPWKGGSTQTYQT